MAVVSGAQAADAIVAAEPEPVEYVRVCDAYGTGYFYIPGTETCLKIDGYVRFQVNFGEDLAGTASWDAFTRAQLQFTAKSDTEYGTLTGLIALRTNADSPDSRDTFIDVAYLDVAGFRAGYFYSWWDDGLSGETDVLASNDTNHNSIRYQYEGGSFAAGISVDELEGSMADIADDPQGVGIAAQVSAKFGGVSAYLLGGYDTEAEEGAIRAIVTAEIGPGTLGLAGVWASGSNAYYEESEWAVAAEYAVKVTDKLKITPAVQYFDNYGFDLVADDFGDDNAWKAGLTVDYQIAENLSSKFSVQYLDVDNTDDDDNWSGFVRLQRAF
jgi:hypothetical protein